MTTPRLTFGSLFSGIGGFDLGFERAGMRCAWQCEQDPFCQTVLRHHWPDVELYDDVRELGRATMAPVDLVAGGYPCQPFSLAGKRKGAEDHRHLWPHMLRVIRATRPRWVVAENVRGHVTQGLETVIADLAESGYSSEWDVLSAAQFGAPHLRERVWIVARADADTDGGELRQQPRGSSGAHRQGEIEPGQPGAASYADGKRREQHAERNGEAIAGEDCERGDNALRCGSYRGTWTETKPPVFGVDDGVPAGMDHLPIRARKRWRRESLRAVGNALLPQIAEWIGRRIMSAEAAA